MFGQQRPLAQTTITEKYSRHNPSARRKFLTLDSNPWQVRAQLGYIAIRRLCFAVQKRPTPALKTDLIVSRLHGAIVVTIPKSGSRSLLAAFLERWTEQDGVWAETSSLDSVLRNDPAKGSCRVLAIVRNPWDRVYSCYQDKIARLDRARGRAHVIARYRGLRPFMPFESFVDWLGSDEGTDELADRHWASQSAFLRVGGEYRCDQVFKLEQLTDDIRRLRSLLGEPDFLIPQTNDLGNGLARRDLYNSRTRLIVARRYAEDIDRFHYVF